jgi:hypothetical protein
VKGEFYHVFIIKYLVLGNDMLSNFCLLSHEHGIAVSYKCYLVGSSPPCLSGIVLDFFGQLAERYQIAVSHLPFVSVEYLKRFGRLHGKSNWEDLWMEKQD